MMHLNDEEDNPQPLIQRRCIVLRMILIKAHRIIFIAKNLLACHLDSIVHLSHNFPPILYT